MSVLSVVNGRIPSIVMIIVTFSSERVLTMKRTHGQRSIASFFDRYK